jgi:hypothetical protein
MMNATKRVSFLFLRNLLMAQHGWCRRVATLAVRSYNGIDTAEDWKSADCGEYGRSIISQGEFRMILRCR